MIAPIIPLVIGNNGAYAAVRSSSAQGSCGVHGYPCKHPGVDVVGGYLDPVRAPEAGVVVVATDGASAPFVGYGPWLILIRGASGKYHLLAHLDPSRAALAMPGMPVREGQIIGAISAARHTHWEVRTLPTPGAGKTNFDNNVDPIAWMKSGGEIAFLVVAAGGILLWQLWRRRR